MKKYESEKAAAEGFIAVYEELHKSIGKVIVGQNNIIKDLLISIFCQGHCLMVGVPGLAKTLIVQTIADVLDVDFSRIQFTPDLMPSDIVGAETIDKERNFKFIKGPIFTNILLADEINRTPPKTQSALLESMQEYAVTVLGNHYKLQKPFFVLATQNPIEQEGTYPLPEAQLDRFMFSIYLDYPSFEEETLIVKGTTSEIQPETYQVMNREEVLFFQDLVRKVPVSDNVIEYAVRLASSTRNNKSDTPSVSKEYIEWGAGPRASQYLVLGAKCHALLSGKFSPDIEDVQQVAIPILRHRIVRNFKAEAENITAENIIQELLKA